jgi:DNA-binding NarL/FixJ family response regulator
LPRSLGSLNVVDRIDSAAGARSAPNAPWTARADTSMPKLVAAPPAADAAAKPSAPTRNVILRPIRSPSRPPNGLSNDEIADALVLSPATAKTHVSRAMIKLGARDRAQLVVFAYQTGLVTPRAAGQAPGH